MENLILVGGLSISKSLHSGSYYGEQLVSINGEYALVRVSKAYNGVIGDVKKAKVSEINGQQMVAVEYSMLKPNDNVLLSVNYGEMRLTKNKIKQLIDSLIEELKKSV